MSTEELIQRFGYAAILMGTFLEGETILVMGGFAAYRGYLSLPWVMLCATIGSLSGDQLAFFLGRYKGREFVARHPRLAARTERTKRLLDRYHTLIILSFRFFYGLRNATPFAIGVTGVPPVRFAFLNVIGAVVWSVVISSAGYLFGQVIELIIADVRKYELVLLAGLAIAGIVLWCIHKWRSSAGGRRRDVPASLNNPPGGKD